jgi:hypothetical protein
MRVLPRLREQFMKYSLSIQTAYTAYASGQKLWITPENPMFRTLYCG